MTRTDANSMPARNWGDTVEVVPVEIASELERELYDAFALLRELNDALLPIPDALQARLDAILDKADTHDAI